MVGSASTGSNIKRGFNRGAPRFLPEAAITSGRAIGTGPSRPPGRCGRWPPRPPRISGRGRCPLGRGARLSGAPRSRPPAVDHPHTSRCHKSKSKSKAKAKRSPARKAKRSPARPRRRGQLALPLGSPQSWPRIDRDRTGRGIVIGKPETFPLGMAMDASGWPAFNLVMRKPHPRAARAIQQDLKIKAEARARREAYAARLNSRPKEMQGADYTLPDGVRAFLRKRYPAAVEHGAEWKMMNAAGWPDDQRLHATLHDVLADAIHAAYMAGCTEGYIEGFCRGTGAGSNTQHEGQRRRIRPSTPPIRPSLGRIRPCLRRIRPCRFFSVVIRQASATVRHSPRGVGA